MKRLIVSAGLVALSLTSLTVDASVTAAVCNACGPSDLRQEALDEGNGDHYLYDFVNHKITHYSIAGQRPRITATGTVQYSISAYVTMVPIDSNTQAVFNAVQNFYVVNHNSVYAHTIGKVNIGISQSSQLRSSTEYRGFSSTVGTRPMTAFDMVQTPVYRQMAINTQTSFSNFDSYANVIRAAAGSVLNVVNVIPFVKVPLIMDVTLEFPDGSTAVIRYDFNAGKFEYVEGSSKDGVGNPIPENPQEVSGGGSKTYVFPTGAAGAAAGSAQLSNLSKMGINIPIVTYQSGWIMACSNVSSQLPHCVAQPL